MQTVQEFLETASRRDRRTYMAAVIRQDRKAKMRAMRERIRSGQPQVDSNHQETRRNK